MPHTPFGMCMRYTLKFTEIQHRVVVEAIELWNALHNDSWNALLNVWKDRHQSYRARRDIQLFNIFAITKAREPLTDQFRQLTEEQVSEIASALMVYVYAHQGRWLDIVKLFCTHYGMFFHDKEQEEAFEMMETAKVDLLGLPKYAHWNLLTDFVAYEAKVAYDVMHRLIEYVSDEEPPEAITNDSSVRITYIEEYNG